MILQTKTTFWATMTLALVACTPPQGAQGPANASGAQTGDETATGTQSVTAQNGAATASGTQATPPKEAPLPPPPTEQQCRDNAAKVSAPDVSKAADAKRQYTEFFDAYHETLRCCYDALDAPKKPGQGAKVALLVKVDGTGKLMSSEIPKTDAISPEAQKCILDIANKLVYPKPIGEKGVGYERTFDFKPRR